MELPICCITTLIVTRVLKPGGWCQILEFYHNAQSYNGSLDASHALRQWSSKYFRSIEQIKDPRAAMRLANMSGDAGLINVRSMDVLVPLCEWPRGKGPPISLHGIVILMVCRTTRASHRSSPATYYRSDAPEPVSLPANRRTWDEAGGVRCFGSTGVQRGRQS